MESAHFRLLLRLNAAGCLSIPESLGSSGRLLHTPACQQRWASVAEAPTGPKQVRFIPPQVLARRGFGLACAASFWSALYQSCPRAGCVAQPLVQQSVLNGESLGWHLKAPVVDL